VTLLFTSVCIAAVVLLRSIAWYLGFVLCYDGLRRGGYWRHVLAFAHPDSSAQRHRFSLARDSFREASWKRMTAVGESFSRVINSSRPPGPKPRHHPGKTNRWVNAVGAASVVLGAMLLVASGGCGAWALRHARFAIAVPEIFVAVAAIATGLGVARFLSNKLDHRKAELPGFLTILFTGVLGALIGGSLMRLLICTLFGSRASARELSDTFK